MVCACESNQLQACAGLRKLYKGNLLEDFYWCRNYFESDNNSEGVILNMQIIRMTTIIQTTFCIRVYQKEWDTISTI